MDNQVPHIKSTASVLYTLDSPSISVIQLALTSLLDGKDVTGIEQRASSGTLAPWESACLGLTLLLKGVYKAAVDQDMVVYKSVEDTVTPLSL